jgi:3-isopropylmalate dehydratase
MLIRVDGELGDSVTSKDLILHVIGVIGTAGGTGYTIEFAGSAVETLSMEARMSISNMAVEAGSRAGVIAPDQITFDYLKGRPMCPVGEEWDKAVAYWTSLRSDEGASYDKTVLIDANDIAPTITWGTSPEDVVPVTGNVPMIGAEGNDATKQVSVAMPGSHKIYQFRFDVSLTFIVSFFTGCHEEIARVHWTRRRPAARGRPCRDGLYWILHERSY